MARHAQALDAPRSVAFSYDPNEVTIPGPGSPFYQKSRNDLPVTRERVLAIATGSPGALKVRRMEDAEVVLTGRQKVKAAAVANALGAGVKYAGDLPAVKKAIAEFEKDEEFVRRVATMMNHKPIRLVATAANHGDDGYARGVMAIENALTQAEAKEETIRQAQEDAERWNVPVAEIAVKRGVSEQTVKRWLARDLSKPSPKKTRGAATRPSAKKLATVSELADSILVESSCPAALSHALAWANGSMGDHEFFQRYPALKPPKVSKAKVAA